MRDVSKIQTFDFSKEHGLTKLGKGHVLKMLLHFLATCKLN